MKKLYFYIFLFLSISFLASCKIIGRVLTGMKDPAHLSNEQIDHAILKLHIPENNNFSLDTTYEKFLRTKVYSEQILHDRVQPLQIHVYNSKGELISFHINCLVDGLIHMKWNADKRFNSFPPKTAVPLDTLLTRSRHLSMIRDYHTGMKLKGRFTEYDYLFIVHWCVFIQRQSKGLVKFIEKYKTANSQYNIKVIYVNDDNLYN